MELAKAYVQIIPSADGISGSITEVLSGEADAAGRDAGERVSSGFASSIGGIAAAGTAAFAAVSGAAVAAAGSFVAGAGSVAEYGDNIDKMSQKMGMSAQAYQEWDAVMRHSGTSMETMKASMKTLANAAESGSEAFDKLGISQEEIANMSQEELFERTISALQGVENETERTYLAGKTLGRGATELGALLNTSAEDTQAMRDRVHELGGVMSDDAVKAAAAYQDSLQDMTTAFAGLKNGMMADFLPSLTQVMDGITEIFAGNSEQGIGMVTTGIQTMLDGIGEKLPQMAEIASSLIGAFAETIIVNLPQIVDAGLSIIGTLAGGVLENLPIIVEAVYGVGETIISTLTEYGPTILDKGIEMLTNLATGIIEGAPAAVDGLKETISQGLDFIAENMPAFLDNGIEIITNLASGILENMPEVIASMGEIVTNLISFLMEHLPEFLGKGIELLQSIGQGILENLPEILATIATVLADIIGTIAEHLPDFLASGVSLLLEVGAGVIDAIPDVLAMLPQFFSDFFDAVTSYDWIGIGKAIIDGIAQGVSDFAGDLADSAINAVGGAWDGICEWLGIASPSKKARDLIGKNWALGIGVGFEEYMPDDEMTLSTRRTMEMINSTLTVPQITSARTYDGDMAEIIDAIESLKQAIMAIQIVMDSGEVVGLINEILGREATRVGWQ